MDDLVELKPLVEERPVELLVKLGLDSEGEKNFLQLDLSKLPLQLASEGLMPIKDEQESGMMKKSYQLMQYR
jgi:hypothetical protein